MSVLCEEVVKDAHGMTEEKAVPPTWLMSVAPMASIGVKAVETGGGDGPTDSPHTLCSPVACMHLNPQLHMCLDLQLCTQLNLQLCTCLALLVPHSPSKSPSLGHHSRSSRSGSSSSGSDSGSGSASGSSSSRSLESGSDNEGDAGSAAGS